MPTVWLYGNADVEIAEQFHDLMGWAMMPIALFGLIGLRALLSWALKDDPDAPDELKPSTLSGVRHSEV